MTWIPWLQNRLPFSYYFKDNDIFYFSTTTTDVCFLHKLDCTEADGHDDAMTRTHFLHNWPFVKRIHWWAMDAIHTGPVMQSFDAFFDVSHPICYVEQTLGVPWFEAAYDLNVMQINHGTIAKCKHNNEQPYWHIEYISWNTQTVLFWLIFLWSFEQGFFTFTCGIYPMLWNTVWQLSNREGKW